MSFVRNVYPVLLISLSIFTGCLSNPFGEDDIDSGNRKIGGRVQLSDGLDPEGVYVWLEGINIGTHTDAEGDFALTLPTPASQNSAGGLTGIFDVYFYVANYNLVVKPVAVQNGTFIYSNGELNSEGDFQRDIFMSRSLQIKVTLVPDTIDITNGSLLRTVVELQAVQGQVRVFWPLTVGDYLAPLLFRNKDTEELFVLNNTIAGLEGGPGVDSERMTIDSRPRAREFIASIDPGELTAGDYEVIPYLFIENDAVPDELLESIVDNMNEIDADYLDFPIKIEGGELVIVKAEPPIN